MKKLVAGLFGTVVLVFVVCIVATVSVYVFPDVRYFATALAFGLTIVAMAYSIGNVSECHINPAIYFGPALLQGGQALSQV